MYTTIGPVKKFEDDFIRLLWEHNVPLVVMVTKIVENNDVSSYILFNYYYLVLSMTVLKVNTYDLSKEQM